MLHALILIAAVGAGGPPLPSEPAFPPAAEVSPGPDREELPPGVPPGLRWLRGRTGGGLLWGRVNGFLQVPKGGRPGTATRRRPRFSELDVDRGSILDLEAAAVLPAIEIYGGYQFVGFASSGRVERAFATRGIDLVRGDPFDLETRFDWARAGVGIPLPWTGECLQLQPRVEIARFSFLYEIESAGRRARRTQARGILRLGLRAEWRFLPGLGLRAWVSSSTGLDPIPLVVDGGLVIEGSLPAGSRWGGVRGWAGIAGLLIDWQDEQDLDNHARLVAWPMLATGVEVRF